MDLINNISVSSVLNRDSKTFGKKNIIDGSSDTCWHSAEGTPQWVKFSFKEDVTIKGFEIQFQGGFAGKQCTFKNHTAHNEEEQFYSEDINGVQKFLLTKPMAGNIFSFHFETSTDFFGRIVIYGVKFLFDDS
ncbi:nuclear receptor 2C2-associated protein [Cimex lectularius]|uniref:F5/8 type C domain-containing protein n=1 Tax=Cimex lectularius TaxID=79782 RepID=A0A8I6S5X8_CIMLE|nr:nuclear receptor 2C2-associated protein [Cimex lectularius]